MMQPPSGGCVLKHLTVDNGLRPLPAATFGWLCVETWYYETKAKAQHAATFGWLCVETAFARYCFL